MTRWMIIGCGLVLFFIVGAWSQWWVRPDVGLDQGELRHCPDSPNCACSELNEPDVSRVAFIEYQGDPTAIRERLIAVGKSEPRVRLVRNEAHYLHFECTTRLMRYVDDLEFRIDPAAHRIHVRSASRVGRSDFGVNRDRIEHWRRRLAKASD